MTAPTSAKLMVDPASGRPFVISGPNDRTPQSLAVADFADEVSASRAARMAAWNRGPMVVPAARGNSAAVVAGQTMRWSDNRIVVVSTAGNTAAAEPAGLLDGRPLADGTATVYTTEWTKAQGDSGAPAVSEIAANTLGANGLAEIDLTPAGAGLLHISSPDALLVSRGGAYMEVIANAFGNAAATPNYWNDYLLDPAPAITLPPGEAVTVGFADGELLVEDTKFAVLFHNFGASAYFMIDDQPVFPHVYAVGAGNALMFDFGSVMKERKITICGHGGSWPDVRGIALTPQGRVRGVPNRTRDNLLVLGDSFTNTVSPDAGHPHTTHLLKRYLGFEGMQMMGMGGSGVTVRTNANTYNHLDMVASPVNQAIIRHFQPKHVLIYTGTNEVNFGPGRDVSIAGMVDLWARVRALLPEAKITTVDATLGTAVAGSTAHYAYAAAVKAAHEANADAGMRLIEAVGSGASTAWVWGTGKTNDALTTGNSGYFHGIDNSHPGPAGARMRARRLADEMVRVWGGKY